MTVGREPHLDFESANRLRATVWTFESAIKLRAKSGLLKVSVGWEPHLDFESASRLRVTFGLLKVPIIDRFGIKRI